jgi:hypothetical protein
MESSQTKIRYFQDPVAVRILVLIFFKPEDVFWFEVSMSSVILMYGSRIHDFCIGLVECMNHLQPFGNPQTLSYEP